MNARDTILVYAPRAPQADIARLNAHMGWEHIPWYTITDGFDADFGVDAVSEAGEAAFRKGQGKQDGKAKDLSVNSRSH